MDYTWITIAACSVVLIALVFLAATIVRYGINKRAEGWRVYYEEMFEADAARINDRIDKISKQKDVAESALAKIDNYVKELESRCERDEVEMAKLNETNRNLSEAVESMKGYLKEYQEQCDFLLGLLQVHSGQAMPKGWNGKIAQRGLDGRFAAERPAPKPVKHLREVNEENALRSIASLKHDEVIECNTDAELKAVLEQAEREGLKWQVVDRKPTDNPPCIAPVCIGISDIEKNAIAHIHEIGAIEERLTILPASKFVEVAAEGKPEQVEIDRPLESYKAFPKGYVIPKDTRVVALTDGDYKSNICEKGCKGTVVFERELSGGCVNFDGKAQIQGGSSMLPHELAPLDDRDHPEHPEFNSERK